MKILITGSSGFLGKHLIRHLITEKTEKTEIFGLFYSADENTLPFRDSCQYLKADILDGDVTVSIIKHILPDRVIHLSGLLRGSVHELVQTNIEGTATLMEALRQTRSDCSFVFVSSSAVYGYAGEDLITESAPPNPISTYGITKIAGEYITSQYHQLYHIPVTIIRPFNLIGPGQSADFVTGSIIRQAVRVMKGELEQVVVRNVKGRRDFIDVRDVVRALSDVTLRSDIHQTCSGSTLNVSSGRDYSIMELINTISRIGKTRIPVMITDPDGEEMIPTQRGDSAKISSITGWIPSYDLEQSLTDMIVHEMQGYPTV